VLAAGGTDDEVLGVGGRLSEICYWRLCVRDGGDKGGGEKGEGLSRHPYSHHRRFSLAAKAVNLGQA
jgi:hypothetical protein